jgi:Mannosyltransferase (PIG-V)
MSRRKPHPKLLDVTPDPAAREPSRLTTAAGLVAILLASRAIVVIVALLVEANYAIQPGGSASTAPVLRSLTSSDAVWYLWIAETGYHVEPISGPYHDYAFLPLYPLLVRLVGFVIPNLAVAGVLIANLAFIAAAVLLERMGRPILGVGAALLGVAFVAVAPGAVAFSMAYPESLFLLLTLAAVAAAQGGRWAWMAVFFALASLTRLPGVILIVPLAILIGQRFGWRAHRQWLWLIAGPAALAAYFGYLWWFTGDPLAFVHAQAAWNNPVDTVGPPGLPSIPPTALVALLVAVVGFYVFQLIYFRTSRVPRHHLAYAIAAVATLAFTVRIVSTPRWLAVLWPFAWVMVSRRSRAFIVGGLIAFTAAYATFAFLNFTTVLAP